MKEANFENYTLKRLTRTMIVHCNCYFEEIRQNSRPSGTVALCANPGILSSNFPLFTKAAFGEEGNWKPPHSYNFPS